jgi:heterodisulfide reductase subunit C/nitrate reductase gamma subunit
VSTFQIAFYVAFAVFLLGLIYRISSWFCLTFGEREEALRPAHRILAALRGIVLTLLSAKFPLLVRTFLLEVLLQTRTLKESTLRWVMHICLFWGFMLLLLMHALERFISYPLFKAYSPTLNPFMFLRNFFGLMLLAGVVISLYRRFYLKIPRLQTNLTDKLSILLLAVVMGSGFLLEAVKVGSYREYQRMVEDYAAVADPEEKDALERFWVQEYGVVSPNPSVPGDREILAKGKEAHESYCASCHSRPQWAFLSYTLAKGLKPLAGPLDKARFPLFLWYIHFLACFVGLAYLPFGRLFHLFAGPVSLLANAVMDPVRSDPANLMTKRIVELDACTHCGSCTMRCYVGVWVEAMGSLQILPSEKLSPLRAFASGKGLSEAGIRGLQEGLLLCTNCHRCTDVCPVGIDLQELWFSAREALFRRGVPEMLMLSPLSLYRGLRCEDIAEEDYGKPVEEVRQAMHKACRTLDMYGPFIDIRQTDKEFKRALKLSDWGETFSTCYTCTTCTTACPIVANYIHTPGALGLTPHQIIHCAVIGLSDPIFRSKMLWSCLGCYQCQEACPQNVRVTDVFYQLKNMAMARMRGGKPAGTNL